ncbi:hypothetical protein [Phenylobacterium kunshanense]|uniref:VanZ family protein n=1 Tax=Phenylobacterium kunshanense TaxID=1445034 RepID=A0A328BC68_9CAUL|nr:hypothetical protein [Phenylobacterium kunshanense]RAK63394.1 hypothetical protein DJ019_16865 [Phenylobacterium kunshanense]
MPNILITWAARLALLGVFAVAFAGAIDPHHNAAASAPPPDVVEHIGYGYLLTLLTIISLPRVNPWLIGGGFLAVGAGFEVMQILGLVSGTFQWKDLIANTAGVVAALAPLAVGRWRR